LPLELLLTFVVADRVCISTQNRVFKAKRCCCGDYHSFAVMEDGDIYAWYACTNLILC
jgi:alpha-tubulin suppressor-like RCC1 family protein